jgi:hypothetical protein
VKIVINYYDTCENQMTDKEWQQLTEMRDHIQAAGSVTSFDPEYLDYFSQLLAKSLQGKGNEIKPNLY